MPQNRLNLNFKLNLRSERLEYIRSYLDTIKFTPNESELDTIAKYILWGKKSNDEKDGAKRLRADGFELESNWTAHTTESLDELLESPLFNEAALSRPATKRVREVFSRTSTRKNAPSFLLPVFEALWREIDQTELILTFYDLAHSKRQTQPRPQLLGRFDESEITELRRTAASLPQYHYLKLRHELVELRQQQYNLKDIYARSVMSSPSPEPLTPSYETFGFEDLPVLPLNYLSRAPLFAKIFRTDRTPIPSDFTQEELAQISNLLWHPAPSSGRFFDFTNIDHLYTFYSMIGEMREEAELQDLPVESNLREFFQIADTYEALARLESPLKLILDLKIQRKTNQEISDELRQTFNKQYHPNYISTLYCKKCLGSIAAAAKLHREVMENIFFPENFKRCKDCGETFLLNEVNFVKRGRSQDGFSPRCKRCEKLKRLAQKA